MRYNVFISSRVSPAFNSSRGASAAVLPHPHGSHEVAAVPSSDIQALLARSAGQSRQACGAPVGQTDQDKSQGKLLI